MPTEDRRTDDLHRLSGLRGYAEPHLALLVDEKLGHVHDLLASGTAVDSVLVLEGDCPRTLISRSALERQFTRPFFREVFARRPIRASLATWPAGVLCLTQDTPVTEAVERGLARPDREAWEPILVVPASGEPWLVGMQNLLREQCRALSAASGEVIRQRDAAAAASRAKGEFLANMSHEIRTPMTAMLGFAELLLQDDLPAAERHEHLRTILRNGEHLLSLINDILDLSRIEAGRMAVEATACSPRTIVEEVVGLLGIRAQAKGIRFEVCVAPDVPPNVLADPVRLRQILMNLAGNAIKFTDAGGVILSVRVEAGPTLAFEIEDSGPGIPADRLGSLFQPFEQGDGSVTRRFGGTGLGLVISRRLAGLLGGTIDATSAPGSGSCFTLRLPMAVTGIASAPIEPRPALPSGPRLGAPPEGGRVLVVDDGRDNRRLVSAHLLRAGYEVELACDGQQAVDRALAGGPGIDIVLMDMQMPVLDGYSATRELRDRGCEIPILAITAHAMTGDRERCLEAGCDGHLTKPIATTELLHACRFWIGRRHTRLGVA
ncbi:MAG: ATP-binding protein [Planctomycetota bacterium]|nr:ATP-binding protein [Planctomycetota bacterium]